MASHSALTSSQLETVATVATALVQKRAFMLLSGDSGSGRTMLLEQVISNLESRFQTVFIPCGRDENVARLRELFLSQLLPGRKWDLKLNLADLLLKENIPGRKKILVVADDLDHAPSGFFEELKSLCLQTQGGGRFAYLASAHPLWTQNAKRNATRLELEEITVPPLPLSETLMLVQNAFNAEGKKKVYDRIYSELPAYFEHCKGNIGKVIKQTEILMDDPNLVQGGIPPEDEAELRALKKKKSHSTAGLFITAVCLAIALVCLVPLIFGTSIFSDWFGADKKDSSTTVESQPALRVVTPGVNSSNGTDAVGMLENGISADEAKNAQQVNSDPLRTSAPARTDYSAVTGKDRGDEDHPVVDDGQLLQDISEGLEVTTPDRDTKNTVTLQGETLDAIEKSEAESGIDSGLPRRSLGGHVTNEKSEEQTAENANEEADAAPVISREDNALRLNEIKAEDEALKKAELEKAEAERQKLLASEEQAKREAAEAARAKAEADKAALALDDNTKAQVRTTSVAQRRAVRQSAGYTGPARADGVPGAEAELDAKDPNHYTLQVIAGRNRPAVVQASGAISGRYWIYETTRERRPWYVLVTGDFLTPNEAMRAARSLPSSLRAGGPFAKTFDRVQVEKRLKNSANGN